MIHTFLAESRLLVKLVFFAGAAFLAGAFLTSSFFAGATLVLGAALTPASFDDDTFFVTAFVPDVDFLVGNTGFFTVVGFFVSAFLTDAAFTGALAFGADLATLGSGLF